MSMKPTTLGIVSSAGAPFRRSKNTSDLKAQDTIQTTKIYVNGLEIDAHCGVYSYEKGKARKLYLDIEVELSKNVKIENDDLNTTIDYDNLVASAKTLALSAHFNLIETYASCLGAEILKDARIKQIKIRVEKPFAIAGASKTGVEMIFSRS